MEGDSAGSVDFRVLLLRPGLSVVRMTPACVIVTQGSFYFVRRNCSDPPNCESTCSNSSESPYGNVLEPAPDSDPQVSSALTSSTDVGSPSWLEPNHHYVADKQAHQESAASTPRAPVGPRAYDKSFYASVSLYNGKQLPMASSDVSDAAR